MTIDRHVHVILRMCCFEVHLYALWIRVSQLTTPQIAVRVVCEAGYVEGTPNLMIVLFLIKAIPRYSINGCPKVIFGLSIINNCKPIWYPVPS